MKITSKDIKNCTMEDGTETLVLELKYTHKWMEGKILVKDYNDDNYESILKKLKIAVKEAYDKYKAS